MVLARVEEREQEVNSVSENVPTGARTQHDKLLFAGLAIPFGNGALDGRGPLRQGRTDEVTDEAIEVSVLTSRFLFKQAENLVRHLPLHRIIRFFAGQALPKDEVGANTLGERLTLHGGRIAWVDVAHQIA